MDGLQRLYYRAACPEYGRRDTGRTDTLQRSNRDGNGYRPMWLRPVQYECTARAAGIAIFSIKYQVVSSK